MKRYIFGVVLFFSFCVGLAVVSEQGRLAQILAGKIAQEAREQGVFLSFNNPSLAIVGINVDRLEVGVPRYALGLDLGKTKVRISLLSLLGLSRSGTVQIVSQPYLGELRLSMHQPTDSIKISSMAKRLNLAEHPQFLGLGLVSGELSYELDLKIDHQNGENHRGTIKLLVNDIKQPQPTRLLARLTGFPGDFTIPPYSIKQLDCNITLAGEVITSESCLLESSLINIETRGESRAGVRSLLLEGSASLSEEGMVEAGTLIRLLAQGKLAPGQSSFNWRYSQTGAIQNFEIVN